VAKVVNRVGLVETAVHEMYLPLQDPRYDRVGLAMCPAGADKVGGYIWQALQYGLQVQGSSLQVLLW
jgi:hypothetical protein